MLVSIRCPTSLATAKDIQFVDFSLSVQQVPKGSAVRRKCTDVETPAGPSLARWAPLRPETARAAQFSGPSALKWGRNNRGEV